MENPSTNTPSERPEDTDNLIDDIEKIVQISGQDADTTPYLSSSEFAGDKTYEGFTGRNEQLKQILDYLYDPYSKPLNIVGLGGMGKTALAIRAIEAQAEHKHFDYVVWSSAKKEIFAPKLQIEDKEGDIGTYSLNTLLNAIGTQCNKPIISTMQPDQKLRAVESLLINNRIMIVMDNMESVPHANGLVDELQKILQVDDCQSKLLITSRHQLQTENIDELSLDGFSQDESQEFIQMFAKEQKIQFAQQLSLEKQLQIHERAGGAPLALRLILGQMSALQLDTILENLGEVINDNTSYDFYKFMYMETWRILHEQSQFTLVDFVNFALDEGAEKQDIMEVSSLPSGEALTEEAYNIAMHQLLATSLVSRTNKHDKIYYKVHPLTYNFVFSEITGEKEWNEGLENY